MLGVLFFQDFGSRERPILTILGPVGNDLDRTIFDKWRWDLKRIQMDEQRESQGPNGPQMAPREID